MKNIYTTIAIITFCFALSFTVSAQKPGGKRSSRQRVATPRINQINDGTSNTIMIGVRGRAARWTAPDTDVGTVRF